MKVRHRRIERSIVGYFFWSFFYTSKIMDHVQREKDMEAKEQKNIVWLKPISIMHNSPVG